MSKQISANELASIVTRLLTGDLVVEQLGDYGRYQDFMTDIAQVVCDHCGGEVRCSATSIDGDTGSEWFIGIHGDDSLPDDGGVWKEFDGALVG